MSGSYLVEGAIGARRATSNGGSMVHDGLWSTPSKEHMGASSDDVNRRLEISREEQGRARPAHSRS